MKRISDFIAEELAAAFEAAGYDRNYAKVTLSNRPDLCEYQCNGAMAGAKAYHKAPIMIAQDVVAKLEGSGCFCDVQAVNPGFINLKLDAIPNILFPKYIVCFLILFTPVLPVLRQRVTVITHY